MEAKSPESENKKSLENRNEGESEGNPNGGAGRENSSNPENNETSGDTSKNTVLREKALRIIRNLISDPEDVDELEEEKSGKDEPPKTEEEKKKALEHAKKMRELFITIKCMYVAKHLKEDNIPSEVVPRVYIGSIGSALSINVLKSKGITHILSVAEKIKCAFPSDFIYKKVNVQDSLKENILIHFEESTDFIHKALEEKDTNSVLVHCFAGKSRSSTMIIAYLIRYHGYKRNDALSYLKTKRPICQPNINFMIQLKEYEKQVHGPKEESSGGKKEEEEKVDTEKSSSAGAQRPGSEKETEKSNEKKFETEGIEEEGNLQAEDARTESKAVGELEKNEAGYCSEKKKYMTHINADPPIKTNKNRPIKNDSETKRADISPEEEESLKNKET